MSRSILLPISALTHEQERSRSPAIARQRSHSDGVSPYAFLRDATSHWSRSPTPPTVVASLSNEAQSTWESLMTLHYSRHAPLSTHIQKALPLLENPSLPLPPILQILIFTSSLTPALRALILSHGSNIRTLGEAVSIAQMAERAKARMDWIGRTMASSNPPAPLKPALSPKAKRAREEDGGEDRVMRKEHKKKRVKMAVETERPKSTESYYSDSSSRSGLDYLADVAVEAAREQFQRL